MKPKTLLGAILLATCLLRPARADVIYDLIASTDQAAAGTTGVFTNFMEFSANASGQVAISATIFGSGIDSSKNEGIWTGLPDALSLYARGRDPAPGLPASPQVYFGPFGALDIGGNGAIVFNQQLAGGVSADTDDSVWAGLPGAIAMVARAGNTAPVASGGGQPQFGSFGPAVINGSGKVAFSGTLAAGSATFNNLGIWSGTAGALQLIARSDSQAPGTPTGIRFSAFDDPVLSDSGALAFFANVANAAPSQDSGIWYGPTAAQLQLLARRGFSAPGTGNGPQFDVFGDPVINNAGVVCFASTLQGSGATSLSSNGIWAGTPGSLSLVVRAGQAAPGLASGVNFLSFGPPVLNDSGQVAFVATLIGPGIGTLNNSAVYAGATGVLKLIAQTSGQAPGLQTGTRFDVFRKVLIDANGRVAIFAKLQAAGVTAGFESGIWAQDSTAELKLVIWEGQTVELSSGTFVPFATNGLAMLGDRRTDSSSFGPNRIPFAATLIQQLGVAPETVGLFFANLVSAGPVLSAGIAGGQITISFPSTAGASYQIQSADSLTPIIWQPLGANLLGTGGILTVNDSLPTGSGQRYYRVLAL